MNEAKRCIKCNSNDWQHKQLLFRSYAICKKCGYEFNWLDYITVGKVQADTITTNKIELKSFLN